MRRILVALAVAAAVLVPPAGAREGAAQPSRGVGQAAFDGDPATTERLGSSDPTTAAVEVSRIRYPAAGSAGSVVLSRMDAFTDSLAGAPLLHTAPLLYATPGGVPATSIAELQRVAVPGAWSTCWGARPPSARRSRRRCGTSATTRCGWPADRVEVEIAEDLRTDGVAFDFTVDCAVPAAS